MEATTTELLARISGQLQRLLEVLEVLEGAVETSRGRPRQEKMSLTTAGLPHIARLWNEHAAPDFPRAREMTSSTKRFQQCVARWREVPDETYWTGVIQRISRSAFCLGQNGRKWTATIDFLLRPDTHLKVSEGVYDSKEERRRAPKIKAWIDLPDGGRMPVYEN